MDNFEMLKQMDMDDLADFLNSIECIEDAPWNKWFNENYCNSEKCPALEGKWKDGSTCLYAYCELNKKENGEGRCRFFSDKDILGGGRDVVKLWLEENIVDNATKM